MHTAVEVEGPAGVAQVAHGLQGRKGPQLFFDLLRLLRLGTFLPFLRASESAMAMACLRLFTVPFLRRWSARFTSLLALREYFAMVPPQGRLAKQRTPRAEDARLPVFE